MHPFKINPFLANHLSKNLWGAPWQDNQTWNRPARISPFNGNRNHTKVGDDYYYLPTRQDRYHTYVLGQVYERIFNLTFPEWPGRSEWYSFADHAKKHNIIFQFYTDKGVIIPLSHVFYTYTLDKNVVIVVKEDTKLKWDMNEEHLYFRTYDNVLHHVPGRSEQETFDYAYVKYQKQNQRKVIIDFLERYNGKRGAVIGFVNGIMVNKDYILYRMEIGDVIELHYDSTIYKSIEIPITTIPTFKSKIDGIRKYLFTHPNSYPKNLFEYLDDNDFYLVGRDLNKKHVYSGFLLHRNDASNLRQVTNSDYSISTNLVHHYTIEHPEYLSEFTSKLNVMVLYRKQPKVKIMPYVNHRLHELNKLPFDNRVAAMLGLRSNIEEWRADNLEASELLRIISSPNPTCDLNSVQEAYGYNAATYYTGKSIHPSRDFQYEDNGDAYLDVPLAFHHYYTAFEYDETGRLLNHTISDWNRSNRYRKYKVKDRNTKTVEFVSGLGSWDSEVDYLNRDSVKMERDTEYRIYACLKGLEHQIHEWKDLTEEDVGEIYFDDGNNRRLRLKESTLYPSIDYHYRIRSDKTFLMNEFELSPQNGYYWFTLTYATERLRRETVPLQGKAVEFPYGYLDVYLNGYAMIEGVDYFVDFPNVYIVSKDRIDPRKEKQKILYRMTNFPIEEERVVNGRNKKVLTGIKTNREVGFVSHYLLSRNQRFNILDGKNLMVKLNNGIYPAENLGFAERKNPMLDKKEQEGKPYEIRDIIVPKRDVYLKDTYLFKSESDALDDKVSAYLDQFLKEDKVEGNPPIVGSYPLYSIVLSSLINDLEQGQIDFPNLNTRYIDSEVIAYIDDRYGHLFKVDPYFNDVSISRKHVVFHPTYQYVVSTIGFHEMRFLKRVVTIYFKDEVAIANFVKMGG